MRCARSTRPFAWGAGADDVDVQFRQGPVELRHPLRLAWFGGVDTENAGLVAVEGHGLAVPLQVSPRCCEVAEGRFGRDEEKLHEPARRVIHVDEQRPVNPQ